MSSMLAFRDGVVEARLRALGGQGGQGGGQGGTWYWLLADWYWILADGSRRQNLFHPKHTFPHGRLLTGLQFGILVILWDRYYKGLGSVNGPTRTREFTAAGPSIPWFQPNLFVWSKSVKAPR
jgi:hypothetical protein